MSMMWCDWSADDDDIRAGPEASTGVEDEEIEVIRCICNICRDEGLMIQCDSCEVKKVEHLI